MKFCVFVWVAASSDLCKADASDDEVCLMQLKRKTAKHGKIGPPPGSPHNFHTQLAMMNAHHDHDCPECPGAAFEETADAGICSHGGAEIKVMFDKEDIEEYFGDNVVMSHFRYFVESSPLVGECTADCELVHPDVHHHQYQVGTTRVRVDGYDIAGNTRSCHRTVRIWDEQPPVFAERPEDLDQRVTVRLSDDTCEVSANAAFEKYESMGFVAEASDNCDADVHIEKELWTGDYSVTMDGLYPQNIHGATNIPGYNLVGNVSGPRHGQIVYKAIDDHSDGLFGHGVKLNYTTTRHMAFVRYVDSAPPFGFTDCPESQVIEIEAHETSAEAHWTPPVATGDNCEEYVAIPPAVEQHEPPRSPGDAFAIGIHTITYAFSDASGNTLTDMCSFTIQVIPKAHPVVITCPGDVEVPTEEHADFGIVKWAEPLVMQHDKQLTGDHIIYPQGVESGMPFPFGVTKVTVRAVGEITGNRTRELDQEDECMFNVTVLDPYSPKVDGKMYRCMEEDPGTAPYGLCGGKEVLVNVYDTYMDTHGYEVVGTEETSTSCCTSEEAVPHTCAAVAVSDSSSPAHYCIPS